MNCKECKKEKSVEDFPMDLIKRNGPRQNICKKCKKKILGRKYINKNKSKKAEYDKKRYRETRKEKLLYQKTYNENNKETKREYDVKYRAKNKDVVRKRKNEYAKDKRKNDISYRISKNVSSLIGNYLIKNINTKNTIGYDPKEIRECLEEQFNENMNWDNYGTYWQIDHIIPQSLYDFSLDEEIKKCWNKRNLRPLKKEENNLKSNKIMKELIIKCGIEDLMPEGVLFV